MEGALLITRCSLFHIEEPILVASDTASNNQLFYMIVTLINRLVLQKYLLFNKTSKSVINSGRHS